MNFSFGYNGQRFALNEFETRAAWVRLHPEFRRRLVALFIDAQAAQTDVGFGGGWRSSKGQEDLFLSRYHESRFGTISWNGKRWAKNKGAADAAPPSRSYHESTDSDGFAFAADLVGDLEWMNANCEKYGLVHFKNINKEPWHVQPKELPTSRSKYKNEQLTTWNFPSQPIFNNKGEIDMIALDYLKGSPKWVALLWTGETLQWIVNGHADAVLTKAGVKRVDVNKNELLGVINSTATVGATPAGIDADIAQAWKSRLRK